MSCAALHRKSSLPRAVVAYFLHSVVQKKSFSLKLGVYTEMYFGVDFYDQISSLAFHCICPVISIADTRGMEAYSSFVLETFQIIFLQNTIKSAEN